jgi:hypothetical protein
MKKFGIVVLSFLVSFSLISATLAADLFEKDIKYGVANNNDVKQYTPIPAFYIETQNIRI